MPQCMETEVLVRSEYSVISTGTETWTLDATRPIGAPRGPRGPVSVETRSNGDLRHTARDKAPEGGCSWGRLGGTRP